MFCKVVKKIKENQMTVVGEIPDLDNYKRND